MALTMGFAVSEADRRLRLQVHAVGLVAASLTMALALTGFGVLAGGPAIEIGPIANVLVAGVLVLWAIRAVTGRGLPYPRSGWQVPVEWRESLPPAFTAAAYGYLLGLGFLTDVVLPAYWILVGLTLMVVSLPAAAAGWSVYGVTRAALTWRDSAAVATCSIATDALRGRRGLGVARWICAACLLALAMSVGAN